MATRTDLAGFLREDEDCLREKLHRALANGQLQDDWRAIGNFISFGTTSAPSVLSTTGKALTSEGVENLIHEIETQVHAELGADPRGTLKVRIYSVGNSQRPEVTHTRTLDFRFHDDDETNVNQIRAQLTEERNENFRLKQQHHELLNRVVEMSQQLAAMGGGAIKSLSEISTVRGQVAAAADAGTLNSAVGVIVLMVLLPVLREAFKLPDNLPITDVVTIMVSRLKETINGRKQHDDPRRIPPPARAQLEARDSDDDQAPDDTPQPTTAADVDWSTLPPPPPEHVLRWLDEDESWARDMARRLTGDASRMLKLAELAR